MNEPKSETLLGEQQRGTVYFLEKDTHDSVSETVVSLTGKVLVEVGRAVGMASVRSC